MKDVSQEGRWMQWLTQARNFARSEQYVDALNRTRLVRRHVEQELRRTEAGEQHERLQRYLNRIDRQIERIQKEWAQWHQKLSDRYRKRVAQEIEVVQQPMPKGLPGHAS